MMRKITSNIILFAAIGFLHSCEIDSFNPTINLKRYYKTSSRLATHSKSNRLLHFFSLYQSSTEENEFENKEDTSPIAQESPVRMSPHPVEMSSADIMTALGTSPRRIFLSALGSSAIAFGANFGGITGKILSTLPDEFVESSGLDTYYPRGDYKRFKGNEYGYTFIYPKQWVGDTAVELAKAQRRALTLDYTMKNGKKSASTLPDSVKIAAFGPPGKFNSQGISQSDTNVSVVASALPSNFESLEKTLGSPENGAETMLRLFLAPEGSGRKGTLLSACAESSRGTSIIYQFEYLIDRGDKGLPLRAISAITVRKAGFTNSSLMNMKDTLITFTVVAPQKDWDENLLYSQKLRKMADTFKLI